MTEEGITSTDGVPGHTMAGTPSALDDALTRAALQTVEFAATVALVADHAAGDVARERLRARRPTDDLAWIQGELADVEEVASLMRRGTAPVVEPVPDIRSSLKRLKVQGSVLTAVELAELGQVLGASARVAAELQRIEESAPRAAGRRVPPAPRALRDQLERSISETGEVLDGASPALHRARREVHEARRRLISRLEAMLRASDSGAGMTVTMREGRYVIPVRRTLRDRPDGIVHDESASQETLFIEPTAAIPLGNALRQAMLDEDREVLAVLRALSDLLRAEHDQLARLYEMCVGVDELVARARWAVEVDGVAPVMATAPSPLSIRQGRHPLLLSGGREVVPFTLDLSVDERTLLITGPNTGGKTVLLKAVALITALAQAGLVPPVGEGTRLQVCSRFAADVGDHQSIAASLSTFSAHMKAIVDILQVTDERTMVIIDEIGSGTDPAEGAALAAATICELSGRRALSLISTHLGELKNLAGDVPAVVNASLAFDTSALSPTYRFEKGVPGRSYGLAIARRLGLPETLVASAEARIPRAQRSLDALLAELEERAARLDVAERAAGEREQMLQETDERLTAIAARHEEREEELRARERHAERDARRLARQVLLDARKEANVLLDEARRVADDDRARDVRRQLESALERESGRLQELDDVLAPPPPRGGGGVAIGDTVRAANGLSGLILELRSGDRALVQVGNVKMTLPVRELVRTAAAPGEPDAKGSDVLAQADAVPMEIDLRGMTGDEAEASVLAAIDSAIVADHPQLRVIHGMGTGVLRERVQRLAAHDRRVRQFAFAPRQQGGTGVTILEFRSS